VSVVLELALAAQSSSLAQMLAPGGYGVPVQITNLPGTAFGGVADPTAVQLTEGYKIIPAIAAAQRYDSNVYFAPKTPGLDLSDYVTTVAPQVRGLYAGSLMKLNALASATGEYYAKNEGLNYVGYNLGMAVDFSPALAQWRKGTMLTISDTYAFTPQPPSYLAGNQEGDVTNPYLRGLQVGRVDTKRNILAVNGVLPLTDVLNLTAGYSNGFNKYGASEIQQPGALLNSNIQTMNAGLVWRVSDQDSLLLTYARQEFVYQPSGTGTTDLQSVTAGVQHAFAPRILLTVNGGAQVLEATFASTTNITSMPSTVAPKANAVLMWSDSTTSATLTYDLSAAPSYVGTNQPLLSQIASVSVSQVMFVPEFVGTLSGNYARATPYGSSTGPETSYTTYGVNCGLMYKITPKTFLSLNYSYMNSDSIFAGLPYAFDRQVVQVNLAQAFF
jgi:hypothetical protein